MKQSFFMKISLVPFFTGYAKNTTKIAGRPRFGAGAPFRKST